MKKSLALLFAALFLLSLAGCGGKEESEGEKQSTEETVSKGEEGIFIQDVLVAETKKVYDTMMKQVTAGNNEALSQMYAKGELFSFKAGTKVTMLEPGAETSQVQVIKTGQKVYVPTEFVENKVK